MRLSAIGLSVLAVVLLAACGQQSTSPAAEEQFFNVRADQILRGVRHNLTQDGIRRAVLNSDSAFANEDSRQLDLVGVRVVFYDNAGESAGTLTSREGQYDQSTSTFVARSDVVLLTDGPKGERRLTTQELYYDVRTDQLWSDVAFSLEEDGRVTTGTNFRSDANFETWSVNGAQTSGTVSEDSGLTF